MLSTDPEALVARVEQLTAQLESIGDPFARAAAEDLAGALMELYGEGLKRIFAAIAEEGADALGERLTVDGVVASLMLIHDLYPVPLEERVQEGLDSVRPYMESHGGDVELLGIEDGIAKLRLEGSCHGCAASASTLELAVEQALQATAPDLAGIDVEGVVEPPAPVGAFELPMVGGGAPASGWQVLDVDVVPGAVTAADGLVVANVDGALLAYRNRCAGCGGAAARRRAARRHARVPRVRARLRPAGCGPLHRRAPAHARAVAAGRCDRARRGGMTEVRPNLVSSLRRLRPAEAAPPVAQPAGDEQCELCGLTLAPKHRHLLHLDERRILCACETCWATRTGDPEFRPVGNRTLVLEGFSLSDEEWASFEIPIALAFFMVSTVTGGVVGLYPSPAGATECELDLEAWERLCAANPVLETLEADAEALVINRMAEPPQHAIVPIDRAYELVGVIKASWEGISGGAATERAVEGYFAAL